MSKILDFRGETCPGPLIKTVRILSTLEKGCKAIVLTDNKECVELICEVIKLLNIDFLEVIKEDNYWKIIIRI